MQIKVLGKGQGFAGEPSIEVVHGEMGTLNIGGATTEESQNVVWLTENHTAVDGDEIAPFITLFDDLQILPARLRLFDGWRA